LSANKQSCAEQKRKQRWITTAQQYLFCAINRHGTLPEFVHEVTSFDFYLGQKASCACCSLPESCDTHNAGIQRAYGRRVF
jgi:hypothetical protein